MSKENIYKKALEDIASASDQANPSHIKVVAQTALDFEETTADEFNVPIIIRDKDTDASLEDEIAGYDKKLSEVAESTWRDTVLHPDYKSPFDEEE